MPVLSIIACGMLEDELAYVLSKDKELKQLFVVENRDSSGFLRKLKLKNCVHRAIFLDRVPTFLKNQAILDFKIPSKFSSLFPFFEKMLEKRRRREMKNVTVVVNLLSIGLHTDLELLKTEVYKNIREMAPFSDRILIFYGTCGNTLGKLKDDFADLDCPLFFLQDKNGEIIEDCISLSLGGNEAYARAMLEFRGIGTIYLTPMWASSWKLLENEGECRDFNNKFLKNPLYCLAAKINTGVENNSEFHKHVQEFAHTFGMEIKDLQGTMEVAESSYFAARNAIIEK